MNSEKASRLSYADAQDNKTEYYMNLLTFSRKLKDQANPVLLKIGFSEEPAMSGAASPGMTAQTVKIGEYTVAAREFEKKATLDTVKDLAFDAIIDEYTASKDGQKIIISIQSPVPEPGGYQDMAARILQSLQFTK
jgi:hypothetical protein